MALTGAGAETPEADEEDDVDEAGAVADLSVALSVVSAPVETSLVASEGSAIVIEGIKSGESLSL